MRQTQTIEEIMTERGHPKPGYAGLEGGGYSLRCGLLRFRVAGTLLRFRMSRKTGKWRPV